MIQVRSLFPVAILFILFASCAVADRAAPPPEREPEVDSPVTEVEAEPSGIEPPEWYRVDSVGSASDGKLYGYGHAASSGRDAALESAEEAARSALRYWLDDELEEARRESGAGSDSDLVRKLRYAVQVLDLSSAQLESAHFVEDEELHHQFVRIALDATGLRHQMRERLGSSWERIGETEPVKDW